MNSIDNLNDKADEIRQNVIKIAVRNGAGHIAPSLSSIDILTALYYRIMNIRPDTPDWPERDRMVFSKAHGGYGLYSILADKGMMPKSEWETFYTDGSTLKGCMERRIEYGIDAGCGSLGHGLPIAVGIAFGAIRRGKEYHTYCVNGDGELQEGTTWEAIQFAVKHKVSNLTIIVDRNTLQAMDFITNILDDSDDDLAAKMKGFGLEPRFCNGHDASEIAAHLEEIKSEERDRPGLLIAQTKKGYGLKCMESVPKFHFRIPTPEELEMGP